MSDKKIVPSVIPTISDLEKSIKSVGLSESDMIFLIQRRIIERRGIKNKVSLENIRFTLEATKQLEKELMARGP